MSVESAPNQLLDGWLGRLSDLIDNLQNWSSELGWVTRRIEVALHDSQLGDYKAPALLLQEDAIRLMVEPIARSAPGADGVVDLYRMPAYDDIASLYFYEGAWRVQYALPTDIHAATVSEATAKPLTRQTLRDVLEELKQHAI